VASGAMVMTSLLDLVPMTSLIRIEGSSSGQG
jgi:hypothetical protein